MNSSRIYSKIVKLECCANCKKLDCFHPTSDIPKAVQQSGKEQQGNLEPTKVAEGKYTKGTQL